MNNTAEETLAPAAVSPSTAVQCRLHGWSSVLHTTQPRIVLLLLLLCMMHGVCMPHRPSSVRLQQSLRIMPLKWAVHTYAHKHRFE